MEFRYFSNMRKSSYYVNVESNAYPSKLPVEINFETKSNVDSYGKYSFFVLQIKFSICFLYFICFSPFSTETSSHIITRNHSHCLYHIISQSLSIFFFVRKFNVKLKFKSSELVEKFALCTYTNFRRKSNRWQMRC